MKLYPKATQNRLKLGERGFTRGIQFLHAAAKNFTLLQLLFFGLFAYVFGALFQQSSHTHNITVAFVDYDQGAIGAAVRAAYSSLQGTTFPTLLEISPSSFPIPSDLERAVCGIQYWAALYVSPNASDQLHAALANPPALNYNRSNVLSFFWNEARYPLVSDAVIASNLQTLSSVARVAYSTGNGTGQVQNISGVDAVSVFANPWELNSIDIQPTTQGSRAIYNTLVIIFILIQEFFYLGTINGLCMSFSIYSRIHPSRIITIRSLYSLSYALVGSLCTTGSIWAFRSGWHVNANQFVLSWMTLWLFAHLNLLAFDVFAAWLPAPYLPMALISWIVFNVTSILLPLDLSPGFYKIGYMFPAYEAYQVLVDIWSGGCNPQLQHALPVMIAWELIGVVLGGLGIFRRCHFASLAEEEKTREFNERLEAALDSEKKREREIREAEVEPKAAEITTRIEKKGRQELTEVIKAEENQIYREQRRASKACNFGPSFDLPFGKESDSDE
jgi:hypothetical protein